MPILAYAFAAAEFLEEELEDSWIDGWYVYNPHERVFKHEWWMLV